MTLLGHIPTDYELQVARDFENMSNGLSDKMRAHGLTHSKFAQRLFGNEDLGSDRWRELQKYVLDTDDIPGLLSISDAESYDRRKSGRFTDQRVEKKRFDAEYLNILEETASDVGTVRSDLERLDFPKTLFYSKKPYITTTIERPPYWVEGQDLIFLKFSMRQLNDGSIPEDVWLQAKLQLFLIRDHMEQEKAAMLEDRSDVRDHYCNLNPVLIAICCGTRSSRQEKIRIKDNDRIPEIISSAAVYFSGALLPLLHGQVEVRKYHHKPPGPELSTPIGSEKPFVPDQEANKIEVGTTVYNVSKCNIGVVTEIRKATREAVVAWEGSQQRRMRPCLLHKLIVTPVKHRVDPSCTGDRVVILGASEHICIGKQGTITSYGVVRCEVRLDDSGEVRRFATKLLHCTESKKEDFVTGDDVGFAASNDKSVDDVNELLFQMGLNYQLVRKKKKVFYNSPNSDEVMVTDEDDGALTEEDEDTSVVEEYERLAKNSQVGSPFPRERLVALRDDETLWLNCTEISTYADHANGQLASIYRNVVASGPPYCLQYVWVCHPYMYQTILRRNGDFQKMCNLWNKIPEVDLLLVPACFVSGHWSLLLIGNPLDHDGTFALHLDSMSNHTDSVDIESIRYFLQAGCYKKKGMTPGFGDLHIETCTSPKQANGNDCGPYTLACIKAVVDIIEERVKLYEKSSLHIDKQRMRSLIHGWMFTPHLIKQIRMKVHEILSAV